MTNAKSKIFFVHSQGICESEDVGAGTRIWAFAHVLPGARIGRDCNICDHVLIEGDVVLGDEVTIKSFVQIFEGFRAGSRVFIGPNATFANDLRPRSKAYPAAFLTTILEDDVSIGANATILPGLKIGRGAMVGAGAVVTRDVPPYATVVGNPAIIIGYQDTDRTAPPPANSAPSNLGAKIGDRIELGVGGCFQERLPNFVDLRGALTPLEMNRGLPFVPARVFLVYDVKSNHVRGEHAHRTCDQFLIAAHGGVSVVMDDTLKRVEVRLTDPSIGLYLPKMIWGTQYKFDPESVLMVLASRPYEADDYIRDYDQFRQLVTEQSA
jgi:UDP-2-acetamido-3-amino-2,3-dideoxy-glucuronate N-acetyltransferase